MVYEKVFALVLKALRECKLLRSRKLGIDAAVIEANAALRRFDRKRKGRKTSNDTRKNPHDPDAKIGRTKRGSTRMVYKPEHVVDLDTGAIVDADVRPGDEHDTADLAQRVLEVEARVNEGMEDEKDTERVERVAAKGYFKLDEIWLLQGVGIATAINDPQRTRRTDRLNKEGRTALEAARTLVTSEDGRRWMRRRSELVERGFQHGLDCGGARRTTLPGSGEYPQAVPHQGGLRQPLALMRQLTGVGTPRQALAGFHGPVSALVRAILGMFSLLGARWDRPATGNHPPAFAST